MKDSTRLPATKGRDKNLNRGKNGNGRKKESNVVPVRVRWPESNAPRRGWGKYRTSLWGKRRKLPKKGGSKPARQKRTPRGGHVPKGGKGRALEKTDQMRGH